MSDGLELAHMNILVPINGKEDELSQLCPLLGLHIGSLYHEMYKLCAWHMGVATWIKLGIYD